MWLFQLKGKLMGYMKRLATDIEIETAKNEHCPHCVWDGVAYWENNQPIAQWITCDVCDWGNQ